MNLKLDTTSSRYMLKAGELWEERRGLASMLLTPHCKDSKYIEQRNHLPQMSQGHIFMPGHSLLITYPVSAGLFFTNSRPILFKETMFQIFKIKATFVIFSWNWK